MIHEGSKGTFWPLPEDATEGTTMVLRCGNAVVLVIRTNGVWELLRFTAYGESDMQVESVHAGTPQAPVARH